MTTDTVGEVWTYSLELSRALAPCGITIALATTGPLPSSAQRDEVRRLPNVELHCSPFKLEWMDDSWPDVSLAGEWLLDLETDFRPHIVHLNSYAHGSLPWSTPLIVVGHSCDLSWWKAVKAEEPPAYWDKYRKSVAQGLHSADLVVAPSLAMLKSLREFYGSFAYDCVVYNGRTISDLRLRAKEDCILTVGPLADEAKNVGALNAVADRLHWPVYIAEEDSRPAGCEEQLERVRHLGKLSAHDLHEWFGRASIYALPARYEPFGLSVLEAALAGCALVLGDIDSLREMWDGAAIFVPSCDFDALAKALNKLTDNQQARSEMSMRARRRAKQYTAERMADGYLKAYDRVRSPESERICQAQTL